MSRNHKVWSASRRRKIRREALFLAIVLVGISHCAAAMAPTGLLCQLLEHPEQTFITSSTPQFGWIYNPSFRNDSQTGYRIIVASSEALANAGVGDIWDSGLVNSPASINVPYGGTALQSNTNYFWRVRTRDSAGDLSDYSVVQQFNTAAQLSNPLTTPGVVYQQPNNGSTNCYPLGFVSAPPVLVTNTAPGNWFIDFGQDAFAYATVHLNGSYNGTNVQARFGELSSGLAVNSSPPGTVRYGSSTFVLTNGDVIYSVHPPPNSGQTIIPSTNLYGVVLPFRYFELIGCPGTLTTADVTQERLVSEFNTNAASFTSSHGTNNQVWTLCRNSMQWLTFDGIYVDGDRERKPYEADAYIHQISSYGVDREFTMARCTFEYLTTNPTWPTEWPMHMVFMAWADYQQTGDPYLLTKYYTNLVANCYTNRARADGLIQGFTQGSSSGDIIDWPSTDRDGFVWESYNTVINAFYYRCMNIMTQVAQLTGHTSDAARFATNAVNVYNAFNTNFWNWAVSTNSYIDGEGTTHRAAHASFFPLAFGLVPATNQAAVVGFLHTKAAVPWSVYGAQYLLEGLFQADDADYALRMISTNSTRCWLNMIRLGSTLTTEAWNFSDKSNEDWNHSWGAAPGNIIPRYVLGLRPLAAGYGQILIQPQLGQTLSYVQGTVPTIRGPVSIQATNAPGFFQLLVNIPGNVTATVMLPTFGATNPVALVDGTIVAGALANNWLSVTNIGSGQHAIWLSTNSTPSTTTLYDNWANAWFGTSDGVGAQTADPDDDGFSNYAEFVAGTDPLDPRSYFHLMSSSYDLTGFTVTLSAVADRTYILERTTDLTSTNWTPAATNSVASDQILQLTDPTPPPDQAFYRAHISVP